MNKYKEYIFMDYLKLYEVVSEQLTHFTRLANIDSEILAEQYRRKFIQFTINGIKQNVSNQSVYNSLFDVIYTENTSDNLDTSKYPKLALNYIIGDLAKYLGLSFTEFLKLTIEETDILLDIINLKQTVTETVNDEIQKELNDKKKPSEYSGNPFLFQGGDFE